MKLDEKIHAPVIRIVVNQNVRIISVNMEKVTQVQVNIVLQTVSMKIEALYEYVEVKSLPVAMVT
jgi:hypothetical protein